MITMRLTYQEILPMEFYHNSNTSFVDQSKTRLVHPTKKKKKIRTIPSASHKKEIMISQFYENLVK